LAAAVNDATDDAAGTAQLHDAAAAVNDAADDAAETAQLHDAAAQQLLVFPKWYDQHRIHELE